MATFGEEVSRLMKEKGLVQQVLAEKLGVNQSFVSKLVRGERGSVGADVLYRLCDALGVDYSHFKPFLAPDSADATSSPADSAPGPETTPPAEKTPAGGKKGQRKKK